MPFSPAQLRQLNEALCNAFTEETLTMMLRYGPGERLEVIVKPHNGGLKVTVFKLLEVAEMNGWTEQLVRYAHEANPGNPKLRDFCEQHARSALVSPPTSELAQAARNGLSAAAEAMDDPQVRQAVVKYQEHFQTARTMIKTLAGYKALHDGLHTLQFQYLDRLALSVENFLSDDRVYDELDGHRMYLATLGEDLRRRAQALPTQSVEEKWLGHFDLAVSGLTQALRDRDGTPLRECVKLLQGLLWSQPSRINGLLASAAQKLQLPALVRALEEVRRAGGFPTPGAGPAPDGLASGLQGLRGLQSALAGLVEQHSQWQQIDRDLRLAAAPTGQGLDDLLLLWETNVKPAVTNLSGQGNTGWAQELRQYGETFEAAAAAKSLDGSRRALRNFRHRAMFQFLTVDRELNELCGQLPAIGEPLDALLRKISHAGN